MRKLIAECNVLNLITAIITNRLPSMVTRGIISNNKPCKWMLSWSWLEVKVLLIRIVSMAEFLINWGQDVFWLDDGYQLSIIVNRPTFKPESIKNFNYAIRKLFKVFFKNADAFKLSIRKLLYH